MELEKNFRNNHNSLNGISFSNPHLNVYMFHQTWRFKHLQWQVVKVYESLEEMALI